MPARARERGAGRRERAREPTAEDRRGIDPAGRSWARRITQYWTLLTLGTILLFTTFYVGEKFKSWAADVGESTGLMGRGPVALAVIGYSVTVVISTLLLLLAYLTVPNTKVRWRPALVGAFVAAVLWEAGKWGFTQYLRYSAAYERIYGSIALIPLFLLWVYLTWLIVLLG
ncbi:MAG TPA: YhjD/YihY/BrkB family envelope integrity protein, partial [Dehalococcoidia bacterium]|nr:YhjD/YihY/BrkB family envelope integrity protein [Dehalococcoidia bacterium]